tara:strand:- start:239 stop:403 length:165 start_codon:yes stop_codon:yes gene_type:complete
MGFLNKVSLKCSLGFSIDKDKAKTLNIKYLTDNTISEIFTLTINGNIRTNNAII